MEIIVEDIYSYINDSRNYPRAVALIRQVCRARPSGYQYMASYKRHTWDGYISLMPSLYKFPTGLLGLVSKRLRDAGFNFSCVYKSNYIPYDIINADALYGIELRDYQLDAIHKLLSRRRGIAKMATNSGKTEVMAGIIKALRFPKTMVLVHRKELLYQTADRFARRLGIEIGIIGDGVYKPDKITVAMIQTLSARLKSDVISDNQLLMIDECHHTSSDRTLDVVNRIYGAYRFGFSGTPLKYDVLSDMKLIAATGRIVVDVTNEYLIEQGYSAVPIVHVYEIKTADSDAWELDYHEAYSRYIVCNDVRNRVIKDIVKHISGTVLILVNVIEHGKLLNDIIPGSVFVHGSHTSDYRREILDIMRGADSGVYIASPIFDEGIDVPSLDSVVLACGGKSHIKLLQRIGRGLRRKKHDNTLHVYDFYDKTNKYLMEHSERRFQTYEDEGFTTEVAN